MLISALCIPEKESGNQQAQEHTYPITLNTANTEKDRLLFDYLDRQSEFSHVGSPRSSSAGSPRVQVLNRSFSESVTPSPEPVPLLVIGQKRSASESDDNNSDDDGPEKKRLTFEFACPFYKRNRARYCHQRSCRTSGWPSVHRVKEHLYRHHMHYVCERCSATFKGPEDLKEHLRQQVACNVSAFKVPEDVGFDLEMEKKLRSRKKIDGQTEVDKWTHMFHLLFPDASAQYSPSPFVDYSLQEEMYLPTLENEEPLLLDDSRKAAVQAIEQNLAAIAQAVEQKIKVVPNGTSLATVPLPAPDAADEPAQVRARNRLRASRGVEDELYRRNRVHKIDFYEIVRDEVRAIMSTLPHRSPAARHTD